MAIQLRHRRGTTAENDSFTGAAGEVVVDTTNDELRVHDGATAGGHIVDKTVDTISALRAINTGGTSKKVLVLGYHTPADGGGGLFYWDASSTDDDDGGVIIKPTSITTGRYKRVYEGALNVKWFGAKYEVGTNDSPAIQAAIDSFDAISDGNGKSIFFPAGTCYVETPILINQKDGLKIYGEGQQSSKIQAVGAMTPVLNAEFTALNGSGATPYTYDNIPAIFIIAATRRTGGTDGADKTVPQTVNGGAAWYNSFEGLTLYGHTSATDFNTGLTVSGIYAPQYAQAQIKDMSFQYFLYGIVTNNIYRVTMNNLNFKNCHYGVNHTVLNGVLNAGTSLSIINCGLSRVKKGWVFHEMAYSSMVNATVDNWGYEQVGGTKDYWAYDFSSCRGFTMSGCGCENESTETNFGIFRAISNPCQVSVDGFFSILPNLDNASVANHLIDISDLANVNFRNSTFDYGANHVQAIDINTSAKVSFDNIKNRTGSTGVSDMVIGDTTSIISFGVDEPFGIFNTGTTDQSLASDTTIEPVFSNISDTNVSSWVSTTGFTNKDYKGRFQVIFSGSVKGGGINYIYLNDGSPDAQRALIQIDETNTGEIPFCITHETTLTGIQKIRPNIRTDATGTPVLVGGANMIVRRLG